jgi:hypothetical protein
MFEIHVDANHLEILRNLKRKSTPYLEEIR